MQEDTGLGLLTLYSDVRPSPVHWLWYPFIAAGKITLLQGDPGDGKSTMMMHLKEVLPEDSEEITADESTDGEGIDKARSRSRAIYFDDFAGKEDNIIHLSDLGEDLYNPECIQLLIRKGTVPVEGWGYLDGMARLNLYGFTIYPEEWSNNFGPSIYERQSVKMECRCDSIAHSITEDYGWTVGLDLPTMETVRSAIETLRAEIPG